jgi:hypothetical protein
MAAVVALGVCLAGVVVAEALVERIVEGRTGAVALVRISAESGDVVLGDEILGAAADAVAQVVVGIVGIVEAWADQLVAAAAYQLPLVDCISEGLACMHS